MQFEQQQFWGRLTVSSSGCLGTCGNGAFVVVYPEGVMYGGVKKEDVAAIIAEHLLDGKPVEKLKVPAEVWG